MLIIIILGQSSLLLDTPSIKESYAPISNLFNSFIEEKKQLERGRPDYSNYRRLLWQCMEKFSKYSEQRSRLFVPLFINFIQWVTRHFNY